MGLISIVILFILVFAMVAFGGGSSARISPRALAISVWSSIERSPFASFSALGSGVLSVYMISERVDDPVILKALLTLLLGISLFTGLSLLSESRKIPSLITSFLGLGVLGFFYLSHRYSGEELTVTRFFQIAFASHLFVAFAAFTADEGEELFWGFNRTLFLRFLLAAAYSSVVFGGIAIAFGGIDYLLGISIEVKAYGSLWALCAIPLSAFIFFAGVPRQPFKESVDTKYPGGLKVFTHIVLLPLVLLYTSILYIYMAKIIYQAALPKGLVSWLVTGYACVGVLAWLLVFPLGSERQSFAGRFARGYFLALIPILVLLFVALWERIHAYGITERRYFLVALAIWLSGITLYFGIFKKKDIRLIPISLGLIAAITSFGPWGAYSVSLGSQIRRLSAIIATDKLDFSKAMPSAEAIPLEHRVDISSIVYYVLSMHGTSGVRSLEPIFAGNDNAKAVLARLLDTHVNDLRTITRYDSSYVNLLGSVGLEAVSEFNPGTVDHSISLWRSYQNIAPFEISEHHTLFPELSVSSSSKPQDFTVGGKSYSISLKDNSLILDDLGTKQTLLSMSLEKKALELQSLQLRSHIWDASVETMTISAESQNTSIKFVVSSMNGSMKDGKPKLESVSGILLIRVP